MLRVSFLRRASPDLHVDGYGRFANASKLSKLYRLDPAIKSETDFTSKLTMTSEDAAAVIFVCLEVLNYRRAYSDRSPAALPDAQEQSEQHHGDDSDAVQGT